MRKYALLASMLLVGCATTPQDCDLHAQDPSFITKLNCSASGGYRQKIDQQEQQVLHSQQENELAKKELASTQGKQKSSNQLLASEQAKLTALRSDLTQTLNRLKSSKTKNKDSQQQIKRLQELQQQSLHASSESEIAAIERKVAEAKKKVDALEQANTLR